ncbi:MAG: vWA domain-containing protein, partial [Gemmatales bacterium]|nr:VWA domain-containing protein [Gemmatales bacterium]MDW8174664.1 vWA domain-containing protein [Gemmatales bacterium]
AEQAQVAELKDRIARLENQVGRLQAFIVDLHRESERRVIQLQKRLDNRFGGIEIAGRNVVFIVDISGSMSKKDTNTPDPTKWPMVIDTVCNFMNDARMMEQYQVIVFSSSARWLFNDNGAWRTFRGEESIKEVRKALSEINPFDDTNLYAAFNLAFKLRSQGLDTIYLFSDGLPTTGPGLTREDEMRQPALSEIERNDKLGRYVLDTLSREWNQPLGPEGQRVRIHAVGFYFDSPALGAFLWNLARQNGGTFVGMSKP